MSSSRAAATWSGVDALDALVVDVGERHARAERDGREDRHLRRRVRARDVVGRICLGVAEPLRLGERLGERRAGLHLGEDEVRRPVHDPEHAVHVRDDERLAEHLDHWDRGAHARLEPELDAGRRRGGEELGAVLRDELLVGGHDRLAARRAGRARASRAGSMPPMTSATTPIAGSSRIAPVGGQDPGLGREAAFLVRGRARARARRAAGDPVARSMSSAFSTRSRWTAAPTVP